MAQRISKSIAALRHRDFRLLWIATFVSNAGSWMQKVVTAWLIYKLTSSKAWLGGDAFASGITTVIFLPLGGAIADRIDRRALLILTNVLCAVFAFCLAVFAVIGVLHVWQIIVFSAVSGIIQAFIIPASTSLLPALVGEEDVPNAIALNSLQFNLSRAIGPILGGAALLYLGAAATFALNAVSFLTLVAAFLFIHNVPPVPPSKLSFGRSLIEGVQYVRRQRDLAVSLLLVGMTATLGAPVVSLLPALTADVLGRAASSYSFLLTCFGMGAILAAVVAAIAGQRFAHAIVVAALIACVGLSQLLLTWSRFTIAVLLVAVAGFTFVGVMIQLGTTILQSADELHRGRVTSLQQMIFRIGQPVGALMAGVLADHWGIGFAFQLFGGVMIGGAVCAFIPTKRSG